MRVVVKLFGAQARAVDRREVLLDLGPGQATCAALRAMLAATEPSLTPSLAASRFAVNHAFARDTDPVGPGDEVALIGLVGGG